MKQLALLLLFTVSVKLMRAQDIIYTTSGNKFAAKVTEINANEVKYKDFSNLEGPTYVITKQDVVLISYQGGTTEVINASPPSYSPNKTTPEYATKKPERKASPNEMYYMGKNLLSLNALSLMNGDFSLFYDRDLLNNKLDLTVMGGYNFNSRLNQVLNHGVDNGYPNAKKKFDAGLGINFVPSDRGRAQYFVGVLVKYMQFDYDHTTYYDETINGFVFQKSKIDRASGSQTMIGITNGLLVRVSPSFNFKMFASIGTAINNPPSTTPSANSPTQSVSSSYLKMYLGYCFGYRF